MPVGMRAYIINFIKEVLREPMMDFSPYGDLAFCQKLRLLAVEDLSFMLFKIKCDHDLAHQLNQSFDLANALNKKNPETNLNLMDYCIAAGFDGIALKATILGAKSEHLQFTKDRLSAFYVGSEDLPFIVVDIQSLIKKIEVYQDNKNLLAQPEVLVVNMGRKIQNLLMDNKLNILILGLAIGSIFYPPLAAAAAAILLLSTRLRQFLGVVNPQRNTNANQIKPIEDTDPFDADQQKIQNLITECEALKQDLRSEDNRAKDDPDPGQIVVKTSKRVVLLHRFSAESKAEEEDHRHSQKLNR